MLNPTIIDSYFAPVPADCKIEEYTLTTLDSRPLDASSELYSKLKIDSRISPKQPIQFDTLLSNLVGVEKTYSFIIKARVEGGATAEKKIEVTLGCYKEQSIQAEIQLLKLAE